MLRLSALLLAGSVAVAADPPPATPALPTATVTVSPVTVKDGAMQVVRYQFQQVEKQVTVNEKRGNEVVPVMRTVTETVMVPVTTSYKVKDLKATGTDGKAIAADDLEKKLTGGPVVFTQGPLSDDVRKVFKDGTVFIDQTPAPPK